MKNTRTALKVASLLAVGWLATGLVQAQPANTTPVYYRLVLDRAMFQVDSTNDVRELVLGLEQLGDFWSQVFGISRSYNMPFHKGTVKSAEIAGNRLKLHLLTDITPDKWIPGGTGEYRVELQIGADGQITGSFTGSYNGKPTAGQVTGRRYAPKLVAGFVPLAPQEHPRLLFRKADLERLRAKAKTPFGQAALAKLAANGSPADYGVLYQLTGEKSWADKAHEEAKLYLAGVKPPASPFVPKMALWGQLEQLALVYDLCYDTLPAEFKSQVRAWFANLAFQVYFAPEALGTTNWHVVSNHVANVYSGILLGMLAMFDEPASPPVPPSEPFLAEMLPPVAGFVPAAGVPVVPLTPGKSPTEWLHTEPLRRATPDDPREVFYGLEKLNPTPGTKVRVGDFTLTMDKMPPANRSTEAIGGLAVGHLIEADAKAKAKEPFTMVLYTVIEVTEPGEFLVVNPSSRANLAQLSLAGQLLADGQVVKLEKGFYPLLGMVQWRMKWGHIAPALHPVTPENRNAWAAKATQIRQKYQASLQDFAVVKATYEQTGGGDPAFARFLRVARFTSSLHCSDAVGKGGFQGEVGGYSIDAMNGHARLWPSFRRVFGYDLSPDEEYPSVVPRKIIGGTQDINGTPHLDVHLLAALFPLIRAEWQPEVLGFWHELAKVSDPSKPEAVLDHSPIHAFLNYPLEMKPAPLGSKLPLSWQAPAMGYYAFRSGWDKDAFVAQVFLKSQLINGWSGASAGTYRLQGLGREWAIGTKDRVRNRQNESVVWFPEADLEDRARGHLTHLDIQDKTFVLSVDLNEVYERADRYWLTKYGHLRMLSVPGKDQEPIAPSGITGMRSIAFDYSGLAGVECLFAVVDRIEGGADQKRYWLYQPGMTSASTGKGTPSPATGPNPIQTLERGFRIGGDGATGPTLQGLFAYPVPVKIETEPLTYSYIKTWGQRRGKKIDVVINALRVPGQDHFFFVGTVTKGAQPEVKISGQGLDAVITVGQRTIRFDGQKLVLGRP